MIEVPRWSVLLVVTGSAAQVQRSAVAFYTARGWVKDSSFAVHKGPYQIGLGATSRDHSATKSNLTIALGRS
jgi:hypothetical protein